MTEPNHGLTTHAAPAGLLESALRRASRPPPRRSSTPLLLAAMFLMGLGLGRFALPPAPQAKQGIEPVPAASVRFVYSAPEATSVSVAGSWNDWQPDATAMQRGEGGVFFTEIELPPGQVEYQFVIDGRSWRPDPSAPLARADGFGRKNSVLTI